MGANSSSAAEILALIICFRSFEDEMFYVFFGGTNFKKGVDKLFLIRYYSQAH